jgi:hypothetical protein
MLKILAFLLLAPFALLAQVSLTSSPNPSILGQQVALTATGVSGSVTFYDGMTILGTAPVLGGSATFTTNMLPSGARSLRARFQGSQSNIVRQTVTTLPSYALRPAYLPSGGYASSIVTADFNKDGKPDLAMFTDTPSAVSVLLNDGSGGFRPGGTYALAGYLTGHVLTTADFDGDGVLDLAAGGSAGVFLLRGNGDGTFGTPVSINSTSPVISLVAGDFNGDGMADIAACGGNNNLIVLLRKSDGSFTPTLQNLNGPTYGIEVADFNGDGIADLALDFGVLLGNGDGTFGRLNGYGTGLAPILGAVADLNGDGKPDVVLTGDFFAVAFVVVLVNGDGTFRSAIPFNGTYQFRIAVGDFNGDGKLDLASTDAFNGGVRIYSGRGDGSFNESAFYMRGQSPVAIAAGDWNGDGQADIAYDVFFNEYGAYYLGILTGFTSPRSALTISVNHDATVIGSGMMTFTITVRNGANSESTSGQVYVSETWTGLFTMSGDGWSCVYNSCTRSDALNPGQAYPPITARSSHVVNDIGGSIFSNIVGVSGGSSTPNTATDAILIPPLTPEPFVPFASGIPLNTALGWGAYGDAFFDVYLGTSPTPPLAASNITDHYFRPGVLSPCTTYYWKVVGKNSGVSVSSTVSLFQTAPLVALDQESMLFAASGGTGSFNVTASGGCSWSASSTQTDTVLITSGSVGTGNGVVRFSVSPYSGAGSRMATINVADKSVTILQDGSGAPTRCSTSVSGTAFADANAQNVLFTVTTDRPCDWLLGHYDGSGWLDTVVTNGSIVNSPAVKLTANTSGASRSDKLFAEAYVPAYFAKQFTFTQRATTAAFDDVPLPYPFFDAINLLMAKAITAGCASAPPRFCPDDNITRGQMAVFIVRSIMGNDMFSYSLTPYFNDTPASHPFFKWIQKMRDLGVTSGCGPSAYCPDAPVTRGQMAVFIIRARLGATAAFSFPSDPLFSDTAGNPYYSWIQKMGQLAITTGCSPTQYCPDAPVTRGQMAVFVMRSAFNQMFPAPRPIVVSVSPTSRRQARR